MAGRGPSFAARDQSRLGRLHQALNAFFPAPRPFPALAPPSETIMLWLAPALTFAAGLAADFAAALWGVVLRLAARGALATTLEQSQQMLNGIPAGAKVGETSARRRPNPATAPTPTERTRSSTLAVRCVNSFRSRKPSAFRSAAGKCFRIALTRGPSAPPSCGAPDARGGRAGASRTYR